MRCKLFVKNNKKFCQEENELLRQKEARVDKVENPYLGTTIVIHCFPDWGSFEKVGSQRPDRFPLLRGLRLYLQLP